MESCIFYFIGSFLKVVRITAFVNNWSFKISCGYKSNLVLFLPDTNMTVSFIMQKGTLM